MTSRERTHRALLRQPVDRIPRYDISFWPETKTRWHREGLPLDVTDLNAHFDLDRVAFGRFDGSFQLPAEQLDETADSIVTRDNNGIVTRKWKTRYGPPHVLDYALKTRDDWNELRERLVPGKARLAAGLAETVRAHITNDTFTCMSPSEPCWFFVRCMGFDALLLAMASEPEWVQEMFDTYAQFALSMCELCVEEAGPFDALWMFDDLCYRNGMLFSPAMFRQFLTPLHRRIRTFCDTNGMRLILHCDGYVGEFIPLLIEVGYDAIQPLEARAGNDVREYKKLFGDQISLFGNINVDIMSTTTQAIEEEVRGKISVAKQGSGYLYHSDHSIPPSVSYDNYKHVMELVKDVGRQR
ncbi:MAG: hypothetical protein HN742_16085 [Lentisphaerae bacterium]|jgi:uroporphyrinogen decarboxylase|nr:hypothetical protein [Lentisphaerota bacterium]MBT4817824.1 hypothetical protein [Lentisphaerota bacterium]MBT5604809.1 hypothetical protein [Lentisphaerota bacterium]MBT7053560.1 hypothetical protein [Lentisphaerota bacterium]MBT7843397.1 hypothetical protein [Lentisphaerota bacterium]